MPFLLVGILRSCRSRLQKRRGPRVVQPLYDFLRLARKQTVLSDETGPIFKNAPVVSLTAYGLVALVVPWAGLPAPISADLILFVFLLAAARMATGLAAMDTSTAFGGMGASRESALSIFVEPTLVLALSAVAIYQGSPWLNALIATPVSTGGSAYVLPLAVAAIWICAAAETARMPIEDPVTHLELTMIHEAQLLEYSGPRLALMEYQAGLKLTVYYGLIAQMLINEIVIKTPITRWAATTTIMFCLVVLAAIIDTVLVRLHWRKLPDLLAFGLAFSLVACLLAALKG